MKMLSSRKKFQPLFLLTLVLLPLTNAKLRGQQQARLEIEDARRFLMGQNPDPTGPAPTDAPTPTDAPDPCARRRGLMEQKETGSEPTDAPVDCLRPTDAPAPTTPAPVPVPTPAPVSVPVPTPAPVDPCARRRFLMGQQTTGPEPTEAPVDCPVDSSSAPTAHESSSPSVESSSAAPSIQASATPSVKAFAAPSDAPVAPTEAPATPAPVAPIEISTPTTASTRIDTPIVFDEANSCNGIFIQWPSFGSNEVTLMASAGFLTLSQTTGLTFTVGDNGGTSSTLAFTATDLPSVQDALDGLTYTPSTAGRQTLSIRMDSEEIASFSIIVNDAMDAAAAIDAITSGVTTIHSAVQPGRLVTYGTTAYPIIMYPGNMDQGPMVGAASYGNGRVVAMPDHQMLSMSSYGETSGIFYDNALQWLTNNGGYDIKIVTYDDVIFDWLIDSAQGYTRVFKISDNSADLITQLQDADVFAGWLGSTEPQANLDALKTFCADRGGGLFIADYGVGYSWWWNKPLPEAPGNQLLREAGIGFANGNRWDTNAMDATNLPTGMAVQAPQVLDMLADSSSYTTIELEQGGYVMNAMYDVLPSDDDWVCRLDQIFETRISTLNPTPTTPITDAFDKSLLNREINVLLATPVDQVLAHRTSHVYGEIPVDAPRLQNVVVDINVSRNRWHTTGMYAVPGEVVTITVPQALVGQGYRIRINAHTDNIRKRSQWERFPYVHRWYEITSTTLQIASAFGGAIFIDFKGGPLDTPPSLGIQPVTISGAIEHPYFVVGQHTDQDWINELRDKPAPYAVFVCQDLMLVQRSEESSTLTEPTRLMEWWQTVITLQDEMAAYQVPRTGSEIINVDIQNSAGAAHSGFPIQAYDKHWGNLADVERKTSRGSWGDFHELGHNHQRGWWTFPGDGEVTVNIFSAYCMRNLTDNPGSWAWTTTEITVMQEAISKISSGATTYDGMGYSLAFWLQLADGFGWDTMKNVFRDYELDNINNTAALPTNTQEEYDQWLIRYSSMVGHDLRQWMVDYWKLQVSADALTTVASLDLPTWMPAMGGIDSFTVKYNKNITFDLRGEALSLDGTAFVSSVGQGSNGNVVDLGGGSYTYEPSSNHVELDSFDYTVTSSSGHGHVTTVQVTVTAVPDGAVETIFADHNNWSGNYFPSSTDSIGDRPVWDLNGSTASDSIMIFFCSGSKYWVLTSSQWRQALIDGGGCGGFAKTAQGTGAEEFWESTWDREVVFDFPPDGL